MQEAAGREAAIQRAMEATPRRGAAAAPQYTPRREEAAVAWHMPPRHRHASSRRKCASTAKHSVFDSRDDCIQRPSATPQTFHRKDEPRQKRPRIRQCDSCVAQLAIRYKIEG